MVLQKSTGDYQAYQMDNEDIESTAFSVYDTEPQLMNDTQENNLNKLVDGLVVIPFKNISQDDYLLISSYNGEWIEWIENDELYIDNNSLTKSNGILNIIVTDGNFEYISIRNWSASPNTKPIKINVKSFKPVFLTLHTGLDNIFEINIDYYNITTDYLTKYTMNLSDDNIDTTINVNFHYCTKLIPIIPATHIDKTFKTTVNYNIYNSSILFNQLFIDSLNVQGDVEFQIIDYYFNFESSIVKHDIQFYNSTPTNIIDYNCDVFYEETGLIQTFDVMESLPSTYSFDSLRAPFFMKLVRKINNQNIIYGNYRINLDGTLNTDNTLNFNDTVESIQINDNIIVVTLKVDFIIMTDFYFYLTVGIVELKNFKCNEENITNCKLYPYRNSLLGSSQKGGGSTLTTIKGSVIAPYGTEESPLGNVVFVNDYSNKSNCYQADIKYLDQTYSIQLSKPLTHWNKTKVITLANGNTITDNDFLIDITQNILNNQLIGLKLGTSYVNVNKRLSQKTIDLIKSVRTTSIENRLSSLSQSIAESQIAQLNQVSYVINCENRIGFNYLDNFNPKTNKLLVKRLDLKRKYQDFKINKNGLFGLDGIRVRLEESENFLLLVTDNLNRDLVIAWQQNQLLPTILSDGLGCCLSNEEYTVKHVFQIWGANTTNLSYNMFDEYVVPNGSMQMTDLTNTYGLVAYGVF